MSRITDHMEIDQVRTAVNLVQIIGEHVQLRPKGREHVGLCPFHADKNPSLAVVTHKGSAFYKCHSCGAGGDVFDFIMNYHRMDFPEALKYLANRAGITLTPRAGSNTATAAGAKRSEIRKANALAAEFFRRALRDAPGARAHREIVAHRGISDKMVGEFMLGAAVDQWDALAGYVTKRNLPEEAFLSAGLLKPGRDGAPHYDTFRNRVIFPICDELGHSIAFGARKIREEDEPKYLNSADSAVFSKSRTLYGLHLAKRSIIDSRTAVIVEGYTDVIAAHQAGFTNVVATLGTALTEEHAALLQRLGDTVILVFDGDAAGIRAADRALRVLFALPIDVRICVLPDEMDPDELLKQPEGDERFTAALEEAVEALDYRVRTLARSLSSVEGLAARYNRVKGFLVEFSDMGLDSLEGSRRTMVLSRLADLLGVPVADIQKDLPTRISTGTRNRGQTIEVNRTAEAEATPVSRARRIAELDAISLLIYSPQTTMEAEAVSRSIRAMGRLRAEAFAVPAYRAVAAAALEVMCGEEELTVNRLMQHLDATEVRGLVPTLFIHGRTLWESWVPDGSSDNEQSPLEHAVQALEACVKNEQYGQLASARQAAKDVTPDAPADQLNSLTERINLRRQHGDRAAALPRGVR